MKLTATELGAKRFDTQKAFKHAKTQQQMQEACKSKTKTSNPSLIQSLLAPTVGDGSDLGSVTRSNVQQQLWLPKIMTTPSAKTSTQQRVTDPTSDPSLVLPPNFQLISDGFGERNAAQFVL